MQIGILVNFRRTRAPVRLKRDIMSAGSGRDDSERETPISEAEHGLGV